MDLTLIVAIVFLIAFGVYFGAIVAKNSQKAEKIKGGQAAEIFHYVACAIMTGLVPSILVEVFVFRLGIRSMLIGVALISVALLCLVGYAYFELPARAKAKLEEDRGWTAEDARTSGL